MQLDHTEKHAFLIGCGILFPMFFTLAGGIYRSTAMSDSGGVLETLPLPVSILTCIIALTLHFRRLHECAIGQWVILAMISVLFVSLWFGGDGVTPPARKLLVIAQAILPLVGLLAGLLVGRSQVGVPLAFLTVLTLIVPTQLYFTYSTLDWGNHEASIWQKSLSAELGLFTIYSHLQYVPLVFVGAYAFALGSLWKEQKAWLTLLSIVLAVYVMRSFSYLQRRSGLPILVTAGAPFGGRPEAEVMAASIREEFGGTVRWIENISRDTAENAKLSAALLKQSGITDIALVSQAWHLSRAVAYFENAGLKVLPAPTGFNAAPDDSLEQYLPQAGALSASSRAIQEWLGMLVQALSSRK